MAYARAGGQESSEARDLGAWTPCPTGRTTFGSRVVRLRANRISRTAGDRATGHKEETMLGVA
jgi:hypothetical protein